MCVSLIEDSIHYGCVSDSSGLSMESIFVQAGDIIMQTLQLLFLLLKLSVVVLIIGFILTMFFQLELRVLAMKIRKSLFMPLLTLSVLFNIALLMILLNHTAGKTQVSCSCMVLYNSYVIFAPKITFDLFDGSASGEQTSVQTMRG